MLELSLVILWIVILLLKCTINANCSDFYKR